MRPFDYFWKFKNKSIISATPYIFSDERFKMLDYHKITFTESLGKVIVINAKSVMATLNYILNKADKFPGNIHIFYNSVTEIRNAIRRANLTDCAIFCADDNEHKNKTKLGDLVKFFVSEPIDNQYKKINFYTCKYFEGWSNYDENAVAILVTDVNKPHTKIGVSSKGKQAIGRLRKTPRKIYHLTNHKNIKGMKSHEQFKTEYSINAKLLIKQNNKYLEACKNKEIQPIEDPRLTKFVKINPSTKKAVLDSNKLDQQINEAANNEIYNHIDYIKEDWNSAYFDIELLNSDIKLETSTEVKRKSASKQLEEDYLEILSFRAQQKESAIYYLGDTPEQQIKDRNPLAYQASVYLDEQTMINLKYNIKKVKCEIIKKENNSKKIKFLRLLSETFNIHERYTNEYIKSKLQQVYNDLNIRDQNGKVMVANAEHLGSKGLFELKRCKIQDKNGKMLHGQIIERAQFSLKMAA